MDNINCLNIGEIRCRIPRASLGDLGRFLGTAHERTEGPYFIIREQNRPQDAEQVLITPDILSGLIFERKWKLKPLQITISNSVALTEIVLCINKNEEFPISGFPRTLRDEGPGSSKLCYTPLTTFNTDSFLKVGIRQKPSTAHQRWRSRTASQQNRRRKWIEPTTPLALMNPSLNTTSLASYSRPDYSVKNSTPQTLLEAMRDRPGVNNAPLPAELSAVEGLIYEMPDTSAPIELPASIPVIVPQTIVEVEDKPSAYALPRKPPRVYWSEDTLNVGTSQGRTPSPSNMVTQISIAGNHEGSTTSLNNDDLYNASPVEPPSSGRPLDDQLLASTTTFDSILEGVQDSPSDPQKSTSVKSPTRKAFRKIFR